MSNNTIKVLEVNINDIAQGGAWAFIKNAIDSKHDNTSIHIVFDFFTIEPFENQNNIDFIENAGGKIIVRHTKNKLLRQLKTYFDLLNILKEEKYDIVHIHSDVAFKMFIEGLAAKNAKVSHIIFHSHCTGIDRGHRIAKYIAHNVCKPFLGILGTDFFACSRKAGSWMYISSINKRLRVINNAIDCKAFIYNERVRKQYRKIFDIADDTILIGHVGRFMYQKNHEYLIEIFTAFHKKNHNTKLLLIGEGELEKNIKKQVNELKLNNAVIFAGIREDVNKCMQAMDLFLLPSRFEGLPVVGIEAQAAGLPCLMSNSITRETNLFGLVQFLALTDSPEKWANKIIRLVSRIKRRNTYNEMVEAGYDTSINKKNLKDIYAAMK